MTSLTRQRQLPVWYFWTCAASAALKAASCPGFGKTLKLETVSFFGSLEAAGFASCVEPESGRARARARGASFSTGCPRGGWRFGRRTPPAPLQALRRLIEDQESGG